jgi:hypothetical protein
MKDKKNIHGFTTPKNYLEDFDSRLFEKLKEEVLPNEAGFTTPEGYFSDLEDRILKNSQVSEPLGRVVSLYRKVPVIWTTAIAACLAVLFMVSQNNNESNTLSKLEFSSIENYIDDGNLDLDQNDIAALLNDEEIDVLNLDTSMFSEENLENYLIENSYDTNFLTE